MDSKARVNNIDEKMKPIPIEDKIPELDVALQAVAEAGNAILNYYEEKYETSIKNNQFNF